MYLYENKSGTFRWPASMNENNLVQILDLKHLPGGWTLCRCYSLIRNFLGFWCVSVGRQIQHNGGVTLNLVAHHSSDVNDSTILHLPQLLCTLNCTLCPFGCLTHRQQCPFYVQHAKCIHWESSKSYF